MQVGPADGAGASARFLFFSDDLSAESATLDAAETNHAVSVLRLKPGDSLRLTDGCGRRAAGTYETVVDRRMRVRIAERTCTGRKGPAVTLCVGLPDRDAFERILLDATALGVYRIVPLTAEYCQNKWWSKWEKLVPRFRRKMIVALKQSHSCWLPELDVPRLTPEALSSAAAGAVIVADPAGDPVGAITPLDPTAPLSCFVGPPGGFSERELRFFEQRTSAKVRIASARLRTELAATVLCAQLIGVNETY
ncbi:MAG: 16S rRNA (uracil(1498)-N(3))-methyltransferase [Chitinispirillaceae bacterium]|nr:16S rRNA (uracil(1498)-N(3))-methyltransferase [Chitinispirillaceae bacterium]